MAQKSENSGCLSILFPFLKRTPAEAVELPASYRLRDDFLTPAEFSFYKIITAILGTRLIVMAKVRLSDILFVENRNNNYGAQNKINQKHLDYLVCLPSTMKPLFGIELDDSSHNQKSRQERDEFLEIACQTAGLPLLRFPVQSEYNVKEVEKTIAQFVNEKVRKTDKSQQRKTTGEGEIPLCPKCGIPMVLRTVSQGNHKGEQFFGCKNFPNCHEVVFIHTQ